MKEECGVVLSEGETLHQGWLTKSPPLEKTAYSRFIKAVSNTANRHLNPRSRRSLQTLFQQSVSKKKLM